MDKNTEIYLSVDKQELGPFTFDQLQENGLTPETLVWWQGLPTWVKASEVPELQPLLEKVAKQKVNEQSSIVCPYCGEEILATARKCRFCNEWLRPIDDDGNSATVSRPSMQVVCSDCGRLVPNNVANCPHCGGPVARMTTCAACGAQISRRATVCPKCGSPVDAKTNSYPQRITVAKESYNNNKGSGLSAVIWALLFFGIVAMLIFLVKGKGCNYGTVTDSGNDTIAAADTFIELAHEDVDLVDSVVSSNNSSKKDIYYSEDLYSEGFDEGTNWGDKSVYFTSTWLEHGVDDGIRIHANMTATNLLGEQLNVTCFFWFEDGRQVKSTDGRYESAERQICTSTIVTSNYQECNWKDLTLWIPYNQVKGKRDYKHLKCRVEVFYHGHCLATSKFMHFGCSLE